MKVKAELLSTITISASLDSQISADADIGKMIPVVAQVNGNLAEQAHFFDNILNVGAEIVNRLTTSSADEYHGAYIVDPDFEGITLGTRNKLMRDDVTVNPIEVSEVSNLSGGITVYIGGII